MHTIEHGRRAPLSDSIDTTAVAAHTGLLVAYACHELPSMPRVAAHSSSFAPLYRRTLADPRVSEPA